MSTRLRELRQWAREEPSATKSKSSNKMLYGSLLIVMLIVGGIYFYQRSQKGKAETPATKSSKQAKTQLPS